MTELPRKTTEYPNRVMETVKLRSDGWQKASVIIQIFFVIVAVFALFTGLHIVEEFKQVGEVEIFINDDCKLNDFSVTEGLDFIIAGNDLKTSVTIKIIDLNGNEVVKSATIRGKDKIIYNITKATGEYFLYCNGEQSKIIITLPKYKADYKLIET